MKHSTSVLVKIAVVTTLTVLATLQAQADCSRVVFDQSYDVTSSLVQAHPNTVLHNDKTLPADYGVRLAATPNTTRITDPFGEQHLTGGGMRYEIYKDGNMIAATPVTPDSQMDLSFIRGELSKLLTSLGCR